MMKSGNEKRFFNDLKKWRNKGLEFNNKVYKGDQVLERFADSAYQQSRNSRPKMDSVRATFM